MRFQMGLRVLIITLLASSPALSAQQIYTEIQATTSINSVVEEQKFTLTATLTPFFGAPSATDGLTVRFVGLGTGCDAILKNGVASCLTAEPTAGSLPGPPYYDEIFAVFDGNATYESSSFGPIEVSVFTPGSNVGPALQGAYAFYFDGYTDVGAGAKRVAALGSLIADGNGSLSGFLDYNSAPTGGITKLPVTGTYAINTVGWGSLMLKSAVGTLNFDIYAGLPVTTGVKTASLMESDGKVLHGTAKLRAQTLGALPPYAYLPISLNFDLRGETPCADCDAKDRASSTVLSTGNFTFDFVSAAVGSSSNLLRFSVVYDQMIGSSVATFINNVGSYTLPDATGRFTLHLANTVTGEPLHYVGYIVDAQHLFLLSMDTHARYTLLSGEGTTQ